MVDYTSLSMRIKSVGLRKQRDYFSKYDREIIMDFMEASAISLHDRIKGVALGVIMMGDGMEPNRGKYAMMKSLGYIYKNGVLFKIEPTDHPLGYLSGELWEGIANTPMGQVYRGPFKVEINTEFNDPWYVVLVHDGYGTVPARPFMTAAEESVQQEAVDMMESYWKDIFEGWTQEDIDSLTPILRHDIYKLKRDVDQFIGMTGDSDFYKILTK